MQSSNNRARRSSISGLDLETQQELDNVPVVTPERVSAFQPVLCVQGLGELSDSNSSMESDENNDQVTPMAGELVEWTTFRQLDYLWLFDPVLSFSQRAGLKLEENCITADDYERMHALNR